jgi:hypothetical protein
MRIVNKKYNTRPSILHCPSKNFRNCFFLDGVRPDWPKLISHFTKTPLDFKVPAKVKVITFSNIKNKTLLEKNLDSVGIDYLILGKQIEKWENIKKIELLVENLPKIDEEFVLVLDAADALVVSSLDNLIKKFSLFGCDVVFNAEPFSWPMESVYFKREDSICSEPFNHLNSGCFIGKTKFCAQLYLECLNYCDKITETHKYSDQIKIKPFYLKMYPKIKIDYRCEIFQIFYCNEFLKIEENNAIF